MAPEPVCGKRPSHPDFDPIWQLLTDADMPICVHLIVRFNRVVNLSNTRWWDINTERPDTVFSFGLGGTMQLIPAIDLKQGQYPGQLESVCHTLDNLAKKGLEGPMGHGEPWGGLRFRAFRPFEPFGPLEAKV